MQAISRETPTIGVVIPAHQAEAEIGSCLDALLRAGFPPEEILVIDDGSTDETVGVARGRGVHLMHNPVALGAAEARNRGASSVDFDIVLFVDADVVVRADIRTRLLAHFEADPQLAAVFGSYDAAPPAPSVVGRYRNYLHHHVHQQSQPEASTFWTGLGAVRRHAFEQLGGFDRGWEKIEDVEFGLRLKRTGQRILLDRTIQGTHLKCWTLGSMWRTDLFGRAVPWSRLVLLNDLAPNDLNMTMKHRVSLASLAVFLVAVLGAQFHADLLIVALAAAIGFVAANAQFLRFLADREGILFPLKAVPFHALHYLAGGLGFAWVLFVEVPMRRAVSRPGATGGAD